MALRAIGVSRDARPSRQAAGEAISRSAPADERERHDLPTKARLARLREGLTYDEIAGEEG
jgi:hypothetical protein